MNLIRYNPNRWFDFPFDRLFDEAWAQPAHGSPSAEFASPRVDIREEKDAIVVSAELPGVSQEDLHVELEKGVLTVSGEKKAELTEEEAGFYRSERVYGNFKRSFRVPETVDAQKIGAEYLNGVLKVTLPKLPEAAPRQIEIKAESGGAKKIQAA
jgi:HSP20 family protein